MSLTNEQRAVKYLKAFEDEGKTVRKIIIEGKKMEVEFEPQKVELTGPDGVDWS